jgi:hypothetical protein
VDVLRHHHIPVDAQTEAASDALQRGLEGSIGDVRSEQWTTLVAAERNKVGLSRFVKTFQTPRHEASLPSRTAHSSQNQA